MVTHVAINKGDFWLVPANARCQNPGKLEGRFAGFQSVSARHFSEADARLLRGRVRSSFFAGRPRKKAFRLAAGLRRSNAGFTEPPGKREQIPISFMTPTSAGNPCDPSRRIAPGGNDSSDTRSARRYVYESIFRRDRAFFHRSSRDGARWRAVKGARRAAPPLAGKHPRARLPFRSISAFFS